MPQTSYSINMQPASYPGQLADDSEVVDRLSIIAVAAAIPYGVLVVRDGTNTVGFDQLAGKLPALATDITVAGSALGIAQADQARAQSALFSVPTFPQGTVLPVLRQGRIWVKSESAVVDGGAVFARFASGAGGSQLGAIRADADSASAAQVPNAIFRGSYAAGFCVVELNLV